MTEIPLIIEFRRKIWYRNYTLYSLKTMAFEWPAGSLLSPAGSVLAALIG